MLSNYHNLLNFPPTKEKYVNIILHYKIWRGMDNFKLDKIYFHFSEYTFYRRKEENRVF